MRRNWIVPLLPFTMAAPAVAGVVFEVEAKDHDASPPRVETSEMAVQGRNLKMGIASGGHRAQGAMIYRGDRREMVVIDHADKSYMVIDEETMRQLADQMAGINDQIAEALKSVPEDQRAKVEKMMQQRMPAQPPQRSQSEVRKTGERGSHAGYPCVRYDVLRDGQKIRELWVTDWGNVEGGDAVKEVFLDMAKFFEELMDATQDTMGGSDLFAGGENPVEGFTELDGFPVVTRSFEGGDLESETRLRSARRQSLDPAGFEPPAGYKRRQMFR